MARADEGQGTRTEDIRRPGTEQARLLLAAGEPHAGNKIATALEATGCQVYVSAPATVEELERLLDLLAPTALVLTQPPGGDILSLYRRIRTPPHRSLLPVVVLANRHEERLALLRAGAEAVLTPPLDETELQASVTGIVERASLIDHNKELDDLTGALAWQAVHERLDYELRRSRRYHRGGCLGLVELTNLSSLRIELGDLAHDAALRRCAQVARHRLRDTDVLGHLGGNVFAVVMPDTDLTGAVQALQRVVSATRATALDLPGEATIHLVAIAAVGRFGTEGPDALIAGVRTALRDAEDHEGAVAIV